MTTREDGHSEARRRTASAYDAGAGSFRSGWGPVLRPHGVRLVEALPLDGARRVLDAGTGVGGLLPDLADAAPRAIVFGVDISPGMLRLAPAEFPLAVMDLERPAFAEGRFDAAIAAFVLFHLADPARAVAGLGRLLRPGGTLGTITWDGEPRFPAQLVWNRALEEAGAPPGGTLLNHEPLGSPAKVEGLLRRAGFSRVRTWTAPFEHDYGAEGFLAERTRRGTSRRRLEALGPQARGALLRRVRERFAALGPEDFVERSTMIFALAQTDAG